MPRGVASIVVGVAALVVALVAFACNDPWTGAAGPPAPGTGTATPPPTPTPTPPPQTHPVDTAEAAKTTAGLHWPVADRAAAVEAGAAVIQKHQCVRCHEIDGLPGIGRPYDCTSCHTFLLSIKPGEDKYEKIAANNGRDVLERYQRNIKHLVTVPRLTGIARRVRPDWIEGFLAAPVDLRPLLDESMIRNKLAPDDIRAVVRYFAAVADAPDPYAADWKAPAMPPAPDAARLAQGRDRFVSAGCAACHTFGNTALGGQTAASMEAQRAAAALAPNLRFARERIDPATLVAWIQDPPAVSPGTTMPKLGLSQADAELLRDFLLYAPVEVAPAAPAEPLLAMPPAVQRDVGWAEVKERVLGNVCVHCHMNDHEKDVGAGNGGGLGYPGKGLSVRTYEMAMRGSIGADGKRFSVFQALPGETWPRILQVLVDRRVENRRDRLGPLDDHDRPAFGDGMLGMPLGLPALTDEEIGLVRRWIDEGCPGPTEVTGKPGFTDGFLVPDGPVKQNKGCGVRTPQEPPPAWATRPPAKPDTPAKPEKPSGPPPR